LQQAFKPESALLELMRNVLNERKTYKTSILVRFRESFIPIALADIALFVMDNEVLYAYTFENKKYAVFKPISDIEMKLTRINFSVSTWQVLLNRSAILEIEPYFNRKMIVKTRITLDEHLIVSRLKVSDFMKWIEQP